jgi:type IV pilus assembly protein PilN
MIRINLVRGKRKKRRELNMDVLYLLVPLAVVAGLFLFHGTVTARTAALQADIAKAEGDIVRLKREIGEVESFKGRKAELQKKVDIISALQANRKGPVAVFTALSAAIPEKCWLEKLSVDGQKVSLVGVAVNNDTVANFMVALAQTGKFRDVVLGSSDQTSVLNSKLMRFNLTFQVVPDKPQPRQG